MHHTLAVVVAGSDARSVALAHALGYLHAQDAVEVREAAEQRPHAFRHAAPPVLVPLLLTATHAHQATGAAAIAATPALTHAALDIQDAASASTAPIQVAPSSSDHSQPLSDQPHAPRLPSLTATQASLLASASAVLLPYSSARRASFEALQPLFALMQSHAQARSAGATTGTGLAQAPLPVQVLSVGIEGERPEVSDAEAAAWVANASRGASGLAVGFTTFVLCAERWTESVAHEAALQVRRAEAAAVAATASQSRWWHQLCGSSSSTSTSDGNDSPAAWWTESPTPEVEEADLLRPIENPTPVSDVLSCGKKVNSAAVAVEAATADVTVDEEALLAAVAAAVASSASTTSSHSHQHPMPSPTSTEVESLLALDARAVRQDESAILDESLSLPRPLSASLHADSSALVSPAACKRKCSAANSSSGTSSSASASGAHSRSGSCCAALATAPALGPKSSLSLCCLAHGAGCAGLRDHACLVQLRSRSLSGAPFSPLAPWPAAALDGAPDTESSTSPCSVSSGISSSRSSPAALQLLRSRKNSHHKQQQQQQQSPLCAARSLGLQPPKLLVRAWSDGDSEVLAAILPLTRHDGTATATTNAAAAALPTTLFPTVATASDPTTHIPTVPGAFRHHPTRSPFARYSDSAAASAHATPVAPAVLAQPLQSWPSAGAAVPPPSEPFCAAHGSHSCTCRGAVVWLLDVVLSGLAASASVSGGGSGAQWHHSSSQSQIWHVPSGDSVGHGVALSVAHQSAARSKADLLRARCGSAGWLAAALLLLFCALLYSLVILRAAEPVAIGAGAGTAVDPAHWSVLGPANSNDAGALDLEFGRRALELGDHPLPLNAMSHF